MLRKTKRVSSQLQGIVTQVGNVLRAGPWRVPVTLEGPCHSVAPRSTAMRSTHTTAPCKGAARHLEQGTAMGSPYLINHTHF